MDHNLYETIKNTLTEKSCLTTVYWIAYTFAHMKYLGNNNSPKNEERPSIRFYRELITTNDEEVDKTYLPDANFAKHLKTRVQLCKAEVMRSLQDM